MVVLRENKTDIIKNIALDEKFDRPDFKGRYGLAVDIGTTTVAAGIFDLFDGSCIDSTSEKNRQCSLGSDVIMRMMHACNGRADELHDMIISQIEEIAERLCSQVCKITDLCKISIVGNTAMCHLFLGENVRGLAKAPFTVSYEGSVSCLGKDCGFKMFPDADIYVMSGVASHVGADAVSFFCVGGADCRDKNILAIDIGTNAEIILGCHGTVCACSAAAGPAFEGRGISCGSPARSGVISGVKISRGSGNIILDIITEAGENNMSSNFRKVNRQGMIPNGICGSGLIDLIAELRRHGFLNEDGYLYGRGDVENNSTCKKFCGNLVDRNGEHCFMLYNGDNVSKEIYISQSDIRNFQLAKAAIQAGAGCLMRETGIGIEDLDEVIIGGMFGSYMSKKSAVLLGLFPDMSHEKIKLSGNPAGTGAAKALFDKEFREITEKRALQIRHVELADKEEFEKEFMDAMQLKPWTQGNRLKRL